jgi:uncharacterized protein (TIGR03086 family)
MDIIGMVEQSIDQAGKTVAGVNAARLDGPTPCSDWDVRALLNHIVGVNVMFSRVGRGEQLDMSMFGTDIIGDNPKKAYDEAARDAKETWRRDDVLDKTWSLPFGEVPGMVAATANLSELVVHEWDLCQATGQKSSIDPSLVEAAWGFAQQMPMDQFRTPGVFGPEVECSESAPLGDRLAAYMGRQPGSGSAGR